METREVANGSSTSVRPGKGPSQVDSHGSVGITTERGGATANVTIPPSERSKGWFTNVLLAITVVALVITSTALYMAYKDLQTQVWLRDDALTKFTTGPFAELKAQTGANQALINAYGLQKSVTCPNPERK